MDKFATAWQVLGVGAGLAIVFYWLGILLGKLGTNSHDFKWWLKIVIPQGIVLAAALRVFKVF